MLIMAVIKYRIPKKITVNCIMKNIKIGMRERKNEMIIFLKCITIFLKIN